MDKFLIVFKSGNKKTGPILVTTSPRGSCPLACPLRKDAPGGRAGGCYAEHGHLGGHVWTGLDRTPPGEKSYGRSRVYSFEELLAVIRGLPGDTLWRHNQAGDLPSHDRISICREKLQLLVTANEGRRGFTYTHFDALGSEANRSAVTEANGRGFTINLSADSADEADALAALEIAPVTMVASADASQNTRTRQGRKVIVCPAVTHEGVTCATCGLCARQRSEIIAFPAIGARKEMAA